MIIEGIVAGVVSNVISDILKWYFTRAVRPLDQKEIERAIKEYLEQHPGIVYTPGSLVVLVNGQLSEVVDRLGHPTSPQLPAAPSPQGTTGRVQRFAGRGDDANLIGVSVYSSKYGNYPTWGEIGKCYERLGGTTGRVQRFEGNGDGANLWDEPNRVFIGVSIYSSKYGTYPMWGEIGKCYERLCGTTSRLGFPTSAELPAAKSPQGTSGWVQRFEGNGDDANLRDEPNQVSIGVSIYSSKQGTYPTWGEIGKCYERLGGTTSRLGFPTSPELETKLSSQGPRTWIQHFEGGKISCVWGQSPTVH
jgi:uncharacterized protein with LGFP repeats